MDEHDKLPQCLPRLLVDLGFAKELQLTPKCMWRSFAFVFRKKYHPEYTAAEALAFVEAIAILLRDETVRVEARHAIIRRFLKFRSLQTHQMQATKLNAEFVFRRSRIRSKRKFWQLEDDRGVKSSIDEAGA